VRFKGSPLLNISASPHHCIKWAFKSADENATVIVNGQQEIRRTELRLAKGRGDQRLIQLQQLGGLAGGDTVGTVWNLRQALSTPS